MNTKLIVSILVLVAGLLFASTATAQVAISEDGVNFPTEDGPDWVLKKYWIGERGPAGGWVFMVTNDGLHGLEAAPEDITIESNSNFEWGCYDRGLFGAELTGWIGGKSNTLDIIRDCDQDGIAARVAEEWNWGGYYDWYLPSKGELNVMYLFLHTNDLGDFANASFWSSSERDDRTAWGQYFGNGDPVTGGKGEAYRVRAVRAF